MSAGAGSPSKLISALQERAKELNCLYRIEELLCDPDRAIEEVAYGVIEAIPPGWQHPAICQACIVLGQERYHSPEFAPSEWELGAPIRVQDRQVGTISVYYTEETSPANQNPFLDEEERLIRTIAERLGNFILHQELRQSFRDWQGAQGLGSEKKEWRVVLDLLRKTDQSAYGSICRKMMNHLCWLGIPAAQALLQRDRQGQHATEDPEPIGQANRPRARIVPEHRIYTGEEVFAIADDHMADTEILSRLQKWVHEDKASLLLQTLSDLDAPLSQVVDALRRYRGLTPKGMEPTSSTMNGVRVSLIRRCITDQLEFIKTAKKYLTIDDFDDLLQRVIHPPGGQGKLGGKSAGLLLAGSILRAARTADPEVGDVLIPKSWYLTSDGMLSFIRHNSLDDVLEQKYKEVDRIRQEYPHIVQVFKNSRFPPEIMQGLSMALDDLPDRPVIVRSSSLLEDRFGTSFPGKYKSLFLANQGTKEQRLDALTDAIAEVYASTFAPDPLEYRAARGLTDFDEQMGVIIQEVVGTQVGKYFFPAFAGVAFSRNEFRWSARIKRDDGLVRIVPGLGTRAVDRLGDDYPVLATPGQPGLRVNVSPDEIVRYSPRKIDVINLESNRFETRAIDELLEECGSEYPGIDKVVSLCRDGFIRQPTGLMLDLKGAVVTFEGLISHTPFMRQIGALLNVLEEALRTPVDIEFASNGRDLHLLQCRPQSHSAVNAPAPIPKDVPENRLLFSANRHVSNGRVPDITHVVYVDPEGYNHLSDRADMLAVGRAVGRLNTLLPKRQFLLMGPGRWGSRGDIKLGVSVSYSDINNTAMLIEIGHRKDEYTPDLSFGTHFFQDLVEASIRYLPLYPDDPGVTFSEMFFRRSRNILEQVLPGFASLSDVLRVIDVPAESDGMVLRVLMNGDLDEAIGMLAPREANGQQRVESRARAGQEPGDFWRWRLQMAERISLELDRTRFGVKAVYVFGSTKNASAGPGSDIDLLIHFAGSDEQRQDLLSWLQGWSLCLGEINYLRAGYRSKELLDVHLVTDEDIAAKTSYAVKIGAVTDAARLLPSPQQPQDPFT